jgi:putative endonuclease
MPEHCYFVYILTNCSKHPLYTGVTRWLRGRHGEHTTPLPWENSYTSQYKLERLVYFEQFRYIKNAIDREKQIKRWSRVKKIALIERMNPKWDDLSRVWRGLPVTIEEQAKPRSLDSARDDKSKS